MLVGGGIQNAHARLQQLIEALFSFEVLKFAEDIDVSTAAQTPVALVVNINHYNQFKA